MFSLSTIIDCPYVSRRYSNSRDKLIQLIKYQYQTTNYEAIDTSHKLMEIISTKQLIAFLETNNLLSDHRYGVRQARSTCEFLAYAVHARPSALVPCGKSRVISLDISKAFDLVWKKGPLSKLPMFGLHHIKITLVASFLSDRSFANRVDGFLSEFYFINFGVPQGSVVSPVLFTFFIIGILSSTHSSICSFTDDTYLSSSFSSNTQHLAYSNVSPYRKASALLLMNDLSNTEKWGTDNLVKFNQGKMTQLVTSCKYHRDPPNPCIHEQS